MKKGFTLIELLAVIAILAIIMIIATPRVMDAINNSKDNAFSTNEKALIKAAELYIGNNPDSLPSDIWNKVVVSYSDMKTGDYLSDLLDTETKSECLNSKVVIEKISNGNYSYEPIVVCESKEKLADGVKIIKDFSGTIFINQDSAVSANNGEIFITAGTLSFYDRADISYPTARLVVSQLENGTTTNGNIYLMYIGTEPTRFTSSYNHDYCLIVKYDNDAWYYSDNNAWLEFATNDGDYVLGKLTKLSTTVGLTDFYYYY